MMIFLEFNTPLARCLPPAAGMLTKFGSDGVCFSSGSAPTKTNRYADTVRQHVCVADVAAGRKTVIFTAAKLTVFADPGIRIDPERAFAQTEDAALRL